MKEKLMLKLRRNAVVWILALSLGNVVRAQEPQQVVITKSGGGEIQGVVVQQDQEALVVKPAEGAAWRISKRDISRIRQDGQDVTAHYLSKKQMRMLKIRPGLKILAPLVGLSQYIRSSAVIYFPDRRIEQVRVVNHGDAYCPFNCKVRHRHRVHDIRWSCAATSPCEHFTVLHVVYRGEENRLAALEKELGDANLNAETHIMVDATSIRRQTPAARP